MYVSDLTVAQFKVLKTALRVLLNAGIDRETAERILMDSIVRRAESQREMLAVRR